jgi:hypothetical protein
MKTLYFILIILVPIFWSCRQNNNQNSTNLSSPNEQNVQQIDSVTKREQDKAIGDINFFISEKQFNKEKDSFLKKCKLPKYEFYKNATIIDYKIGGYGFNSLDGWFYKDSLYSVEMTGCIISYNDYDRIMPDQYNALFDVLKLKYGNPKTEISLPSWSSIDKGYFKSCAIWNIGDKKIEARIVSSGTLIL